MLRLPSVTYKLEAKVHLEKGKCQCQCHEIRPPKSDYTKMKRFLSFETTKFYELALISEFSNSQFLRAKLLMVTYGRNVK